MKKNDSRKNFLQQTAACVFVIGSLALSGDGSAATATGTATATVLESVSVSISAPPTPALSGTIFTIEGFTDSLSPGGPLLRVISPPADVVSGTGGAGAPPPPGSATVTVRVNADGSLSISVGSNLIFTLIKSADGAVIIEYN